MNRQPKALDEQIAAEDLVALPLEELEALLLQIYATLEKTFHAMSGYAQGATQVEASSLRGAGLEQHWQTRWEVLKATVDAIIYHAVFSGHDEQEWNKLIQGLREYMACMQTVTSGEDITREWLQRRDALVARTASLLKEVFVPDWTTRSVGSPRDALHAVVTPSGVQRDQS